MYSSKYTVPPKVWGRASMVFFFNVFCAFKFDEGDREEGGGGGGGRFTVAQVCLNRFFCWTMRKWRACVVLADELTERSRTGSTGGSFGWDRRIPSVLTLDTDEIR